MCESVVSLRALGTLTLRQMSCDFFWGYRKVTREANFIQMKELSGRNVSKQVHCLSLLHLDSCFCYSSSYKGTCIIWLMRCSHFYTQISNNKILKGGINCQKLFSFRPALTPVISASVTNWELIISPKISSQMFIWTEQLSKAKCNRMKLLLEILWKTFFVAAMNKLQRTELKDVGDTASCVCAPLMEAVQHCEVKWCILISDTYI